MSITVDVLFGLGVLLVSFIASILIFGVMFIDHDKLDALSEDKKDSALNGLLIICFLLSIGIAILVTAIRIKS